MTQTNKYIWVTFQHEAIHKYPAALSDPKLATGDYYDVSFLGHPHRHVFHFRVCIQVWHDDREIEFIQFKRWLQGLLRQDGSTGGSSILDLNYKSCEMISDDMYKHISARYPGREVQIEVSEDGENGCFCTYSPQAQ